MTITLELSDEQARRLKARAAQHGRKVEEYLLDLAEHDLDDVEWDSLADELARLVPETISPLPDAALRRETMYRE